MRSPRQLGHEYASWSASDSTSPEVDLSQWEWIQNCGEGGTSGVSGVRRRVRHAPPALRPRRVRSHLTRVALDHVHVLVVVHEHADRAVLLLRELAAARRAHLVPLVPAALRVRRAARVAHRAVGALEPAGRPRLERAVRRRQALDVPPLLTLVARGESDLGAVLLAPLARLAPQALPLLPRVGPPLERRLLEALDVHAVAARPTLQHPKLWPTCP